MKTRIILVTPFRGNGDGGYSENIHFARRCMYDSLARGEAPFASHLLYPIRCSGVLDDTKADERQRGLDAEKQWIKQAELLVVYTDQGISSGMQKAIEYAGEIQLPTKFRVLGSSEFAPEEGLIKRLGSGEVGM